MRVWIDLANSPHVLFFEAVVDDLRARGDEVVLTARDHAQTVELARSRWPEVEVVGGRSPGGALAKGRAVARRALDLRRLVAGRVDVALSHGSYPQLVAARLARLPSVTLMDYEFQPANHLSFRLAERVVVPEAFPDDALRRFGARGRRVVRYPGFKEELSLAGFTPDESVLRELELDAERVIVVLRPPPDGALYHRLENERFDEIFEAVVAAPGVDPVVLPRSPEQGRRYARARVPERAVDGRSLLAVADVVVGGGGTMTREAALLGTPTATVFAGKLAAVDAELIRRGLLLDLRAGGVPRLEKKRARPRPADADRAGRLLETIRSALADVAAQA